MNTMVVVFVMLRKGLKLFYWRSYSHDYHMIFISKFKVPIVKIIATTSYWSMIILVFDPGNSFSCGAAFAKLVAVTMKKLDFKLPLCKLKEEL